MNVELLRKVQKAILEEPKRLRMSCYMTARPSGRSAYEYPACGAVGCIAGWSLVLNKQPKDNGEIHEIARDLELYGGLGDMAQELLGLDYEQRMRLFHETWWPDEYYVRYRKAHDDPQAMAQVVAEYIDYFIEEEGQKNVGA